MTASKSDLYNALVRLHRDERGLESLEIALLLIAFILPMSYFLLKIAQAISDYYSFVSLVLSSPFL
jgi:hypothetical protein